MSEIKSILDSEQKKRVKDTRQPEWTAPMLATLTHDHFSNENWIYERKFDGQRVLCFKKGKSIELKSRNKRNLNDTYPEIVEAIKKQKGLSFIIDGEVVAFKGNVTSFSRLQLRMHSDLKEEGGDFAVYYYVFDILHLDGKDLTKISLRERKKILRKNLKFDNHLRFTAHRNKEGEKYHEEACKKGWEGLIAKDAGSNYVHSRSKKWLKFKCVNQQEFVIGGYTDPQGQRIGFGALMIGYYDNGDLKYAGKVGTGYDDDTLEWLKDKFDKLERKRSPFDDEVNEKNANWVKPKLVAEIGFTEWTGDHKLRHPRYLGLREDKKASQVKKEA